MKEKWRQIVGFEGFYEVSNLGRVRSVNRFVPHRLAGLQKRKGRILRACVNNSTGHLRVNLWKNGKGSKFHVHTLVAEAWIGPRPDNMEVCHGSNGVSDNSVSNIRYDTHVNNLREAADEKHAQTKRVRRSDGEEFISLAEAGWCTPGASGHISAVCSGKRKSAGGYGWSYC